MWIDPARPETAIVATLIGMARSLRIPLVSMMLVSLGAVCAADVPASARSRAAVERVRSRLGRELSERGLVLGSPVFLRIFKASDELEVWVENGTRFELFRTYPICRWSGRLGPKLRAGDGQSPEGFYFVTPGQMNPHSRYHLSFNLGYPNAFDRHHGRTGSALMVHGRCVSVGCYAMTDGPIEEIWTLADAAFRSGQPFFRVHVFPFRMTDENLRPHRTSRWLSFWRNLREGYEAFERDHRPPDVAVRNGAYVFRPDR